MAAREAALQTSAAALPAAASIPDLHPSPAKAEGSSGAPAKSVKADAAATPASRGRGTQAGRGSSQRRGKRGARQTDKVVDKERGDADEMNKVQRKRTRSGLIDDLEEI